MTVIIDPNAPAVAQAAQRDVIKDGDTRSFARDVIEASMETPVIVDFWAPWCGPCKQLGPMMEKLVRQAAGLVRLVKINIDENKELAAQLRVQSVPMVYAFVGGQPVDGFVGAQPESKLRAFIDKLTGGARAPLDDALEQAQAALDDGDPRRAAAIFSHILAEDPTNPKAIAGLIRAAVAGGDLAGAREIADGLTAELARVAEVASAIAAIELAEQGGSTAGLSQLQETVAREPENHQARLDLAMALYGANRPEAAIDELLELFRRERGWNDDAARKQLVKIFDALGSNHPLTVASRRRLSSLLFS